MSEGEREGEERRERISSTLIHERERKKGGEEEEGEGEKGKVKQRGRVDREQRDLEVRSTEEDAKPNLSNTHRCESTGHERRRRTRR